VDEQTPNPDPQPERIYRHALPVRIWHWINALAVFVLIMTGLQIFNAHPALYWGERSDRDKPLLSMRATKTESGEVKGVTTVLGAKFDTTDVFGYSGDRVRGFPAWATIPSGKWLAMGRQWHFFFAWMLVLNILIFMGYVVVKGHIKRDLLPTGADIRNIGRSLKDHLLFRHETGEVTKRYNVLQKLAYLGVLFGLFPLIVLTGLTMSPTMDAAFPFLLDLFGGRQSARTVHFVACFLFVGFIAIHVSQVILTGFFNNIRSMVTGWFTVPAAGATHEQSETPSQN
jgi:thiosulfate reductase cytochrome b subunit